MLGISEYKLTIQEFISLWKTELNTIQRSKDARTLTPLIHKRSAFWLFGVLTSFKTKLAPTGRLLANHALYRTRNCWEGANWDTLYRALTFFFPASGEEIYNCEFVFKKQNSFCFLAAEPNTDEPTPPRVEMRDYKSTGRSPTDTALTLWNSR